jgi:hypothetical protein
LFGQSLLGPDLFGRHSGSMPEATAARKISSTLVKDHSSALYHYDDHASGGHPCRPCVRAQQEAAEQAARQQLDQAVADATGFLKDWTENTAPRRVLARQLLAWGKELHTAWNAWQTAAQRPAPPAPPAKPAPRGGTRSPAARTALQQLLADLEAERTGQPAPGTEAPLQVQPPAPRRAVIQRGPARTAAQAAPPPQVLPPAATRAELQARYAGMSEPLRSRIIALIEDRQRQQCEPGQRAGRTQQVREDESS